MDVTNTLRNTKAMEVASQDETGASDSKESGLKKTKSGQKATKKTVHLGSGTGSDGTAATAGAKSHSSHTSSRKAPSLPRSATDHPPKRSDATTDRGANAEGSKNRKKDRNHNAGTTATTKSTSSRRTPQDKDDDTSITPQAVDAIRGRPKSTRLPAQKQGEKPSAAITGGATKQHQAQQPATGKPIADSTDPAPASFQRKTKAQDEPHAATPRSTGDSTAATMSIAPQLSGKSPPLAVSPPTGQGPSEQGVRAPDRPVTTRKRRAASAPIEEEGQGRKRSRFDGEGEEDWRAAPVVFARRPQDSINNTERDGDAAAEGAASGIGDVHVQGEGGDGHAGAEDGQQLDLPEQPSSIELTRGYGAVMGIAFGAGTFALRHWT